MLFSYLIAKKAAAALSGGSGVQKQYIETDGNCWITTDIPVFYNPSIIAAFYLTYLPSSSGFNYNQLLYTFGNNTGDQNYSTHVRLQRDSGGVYLYCVAVTSTGRRYQRYGALSSSIAPVSISVKQLGTSSAAYTTSITFDKNNITTSLSSSSTGSITKQDAVLTVMGDNRTTQGRALRNGSRCYGLDIYQDTSCTNLLYSLRPWQMGSQAGLYDVINNKFYGNSGPGTLTCSAT